MKAVTRGFAHAGRVEVRRRIWWSGVIGHGGLLVGQVGVMPC